MKKYICVGGMPKVVGRFIENKEDVGLLCAMSELDIESVILGNDIFVEFKGALIEQYVLEH